jgi:hypothetical protein
LAFGAEANRHYLKTAARDSFNLGRRDTCKIEKADGTRKKEKENFQEDRSN